MNIPPTPFNIRFVSNGQTRIASCMHAEQIDSNIAGTCRLVLAASTAPTLPSANLLRLVSKRGNTLDATVLDIRRTAGGTVFMEIVALIPEIWFAPHVVACD